MPPVTEKPELYGTPTSPVAAEQESAIGGGLVTLIKQALEAVAVSAEPPEESDTWPVKEKRPGAVGVPVIAPVVGFNVRPLGKVPVEIEYEYGGTPPPAIRAEL